MKEYHYDKLMGIKTGGDQKGFHKSFHYHRYEPTPYSALEELFTHYQVSRNDRIIDFGCGKGRLNFFIHYHFHATVIGIEMSRDFYQEAIENRKKYHQTTHSINGDIFFHCCLAEEYQINPLDNRFYFFNPFSIQIFMKIINNILLSVENAKRDVEIILYYPSDDYIYYLENDTMFELKKEIILPYVHEHNPNERFLIYRLTI
ncbi:methyltransferase [Bacillus sp. UNC41MFS5]|uniref:methyltransferase n=1 Tax=Bacillus sp. UNC41MFS5 TaxID=1449046 RepID=UPI00047B695D|nr:methyltransferase domain-containing protein [Bacillus sp. UNC41MFS5]